MEHPLLYRLYFAEALQDPDCWEEIYDARIWKIEVSSCNHLEACKPHPVPFDCGIQIGPNYVLLEGGLDHGGFGKLKVYCPKDAVDTYYKFVIWFDEDRLIDKILKHFGIVGIRYEEIL